MSTVPLATQLGQALIEKKWIIGTAESCTGGLLAAALTDVAGSSQWFEEGLVTYSNRSKMGLLGVDENLLTQYGAVSKSVVEAMAQGVVGRGATVAIATSGVAGPDGGSLDKPVGTVWFAWQVNGRSYSECRQFDGDRFAVRKQATEYALAVVLKLIQTTV